MAEERDDLQTNSKNYKGRIIIIVFVLCVVGNKNGICRIGSGKAREALSAKEKATKRAKKNLIIIRRGAGSWGSFGAGAHTLPFAINGKCGRCKIKFMPAPKGTGLIVESELKKLLELCGIKDCWSKSFGQTKNKINLIKAGFEALKQLQKMKLTKRVIENRCIMDGGKNEEF